MTYSSSSPVVTTTSIILCFNKHWLTQVHLETDRDSQLPAGRFCDVMCCFFMFLSNLQYFTM